MKIKIFLALLLGILVEDALNDAEHYFKPYYCKYMAPKNHTEYPDHIPGLIFWLEADD